jgi:hypothetical protein
VTEAAPGPAAETPAEPAAEGTEHIQERGEDEAAAPAAEAVPAEPDHKGLLHELAGHVRVVAASEKRDVYELVAWLCSHGL